MGRILLKVFCLSTWSTVSVIFIGSSVGLSQGYTGAPPGFPEVLAAVEEQYTLDCITLSYSSFHRPGCDGCHQALVTTGRPERFQNSRALFGAAKGGIY